MKFGAFHICWHRNCVSSVDFCAVCGRSAPPVQAEILIRHEDCLSRSRDSVYACLVILENFRLKVFQAFAEHLSFRKAGEALYLTQPAVTLQIKALGIPDRIACRVLEWKRLEHHFGIAAGSIAAQFMDALG